MVVKATSFKVTVKKGRNSNSSKPSITQKRANQSEFWGAANFGWFEQKLLIPARFPMSSISIFSLRDLFFYMLNIEQKKKKE